MSGSGGGHSGNRCSKDSMFYKIGSKLKEYKMNDWQDLHNDNGGDESDKVVVEKEIEIGNNVVYEYKAEVELFRGIPCRAEVVAMTRIVYDEEGDFDEPYELCVSEFPEYITRAAEKKAVEEI